MLKNLTNVSRRHFGCGYNISGNTATSEYGNIFIATTISIVPEGLHQETETKEVVPEKPKVKRLVCKGCQIIMNP
jgi:hypothetical protein